MEDLKIVVQSLQANLIGLGEKDRGFASDLCIKFAKYGASEKQEFWIRKLADRATGKEVKPELAQVAVGTFSKVMALFQRAKKNLKFPKIALLLPTGEPVEMSLAGPYSKAPGTVNVTDGQPFGQNLWYGRVDEQGTWTQGPRATPEAQTKIFSLLQEFGDDPSGVAGKYGLLTGRCCFCSKKLTDDKSVAAGYGPTCAENYGLKAEWKKAVSVLEAA